MFFFFLFFFVAIPECVTHVAHKQWPSGCLFDVVVYYGLCTCDTPMRIIVIRQEMDTHQTWKLT